MKGWRAKLGFLVPAGTPTVENEMFELAPPGVSVHFSRMVGRGADGTLKGLEERLTSQIEHMQESTELLAAVKPKVIAIAHTATSYRLGKDEELAMAQRLGALTGIPFVTTVQCVVAALNALGVTRVALGTPYDEGLTNQARLALQDYGFQVTKFAWLENVRSIFDETEERAYWLGRGVDTAEAEAVFLSGVGMPTIGVLDVLEQDLRKPVISSASALMWYSLRTAGIASPIAGYGRLLQTT